MDVIIVFVLILTLSAMQAWDERHGGRLMARLDDDPPRRKPMAHRQRRTRW